MLLDAWLARAATRRPDARAVVADSGTLTYAELHARVRRAAAGLLGEGVRPGEHVGLVLGVDLPFVVALHACLRAGAVAVPVDPRLRDDERRARTHGCALVLDAPAPERDGDPPAVAAGLAHPAVVVHTSGTTAAPRPVTLTHGNWWWSAAGSAVALGHDPHERWLCALPVSHVGGLSILLRAAIGATTAVLHQRFDAARVAALLADPAGPTVISVVPTMLARLLDAGLRESPALRVALVGGGPTPAALLARAAAAGVPAVPTYGMTEACSQITTGGAALFCTRVGIDAPAPGHPGEILVRGPTVAPGATGDDGWLHTGDLGTLGDDGHLHVTGRIADTIVTGGENVAPAEVEAALEAHPSVAEAVVHPRPDEVWGERVVATVVLLPGAVAGVDELRDHVRGRLAAFKVPKEIAFARVLPRTASGKLLRRSL